MSRLIDADAVLERIERDCDARCLYKDYKEPLRSKLCKSCELGDARMYVEDAPTVDAERHGHWEEHPLDWEQRVCSVCGGTAETITYHLKDGRVRSKGTPYCPHCGALMEEEVEDDE